MDVETVGANEWLQMIYIYINVCGRLQICVSLLRFIIPSSSNGFFRVDTCVSMEEKKKVDQD